MYNNYPTTVNRRISTPTPPASHRTLPVNPATVIYPQNTENPHQVHILNLLKVGTRRGIRTLTRWGFLYEILSKKGGIYCEKQVVVPVLSVAQFQSARKSA